MAIGLLLLAVAGSAAFISLQQSEPQQQAPAVAAVRPSTPKRVEQGEKIVTVMCAHCHRNPSTNTLAGRPMPDLGTDFGKLYSANITKDPKFGIGDWTDQQIVTMVRTGAGPDGRLRVAMPHFAYLSDEDAASIVAFLRSNNALVLPTAEPSHPQELSPLGKNLLQNVLKPTPLVKHLADAPPASQPVALGHYLVVGRYQCYFCHSQDFSTNNEAKPELSKGFLGGGHKMLDDELQLRISRNLTMDPETGLGKWSEAQFSKAVKFGMAPTGILHAPMPKFSTMTDEEVHALWAYLKTVPKIKNATPEDVAVTTK
ncbi:cytochrome c [Hymenobacter sp. BT770]|uniref:c-type cytochrome n=1 Tax=Hymenobacter sp. BT770 TaxID=2886942 RepID=UPI001D111131|nr:cytochrome c [Hymenobacter sp. BT770]MCC3152485.1 cytochrome c [Hymenobacter sp. BT770]MDO3414539.1 cytochrome c [Hymenobacter sp. BT770]